MRVNTRSNTRQRQVRSSIHQSLTLDEKNKRKAITLFIARVVYARLERAAGKKQGVIRKAYIEYKQRYNWITERQIRYAVNKFTTRISVPSTNSPILTRNDVQPERMNCNETSNEVETNGVILANYTRYFSLRHTCYNHIMITRMLVRK